MLEQGPEYTCEVSSSASDSSNLASRSLEQQGHSSDRKSYRHRFRLSADDWWIGRPETMIRRRIGPFHIRIMVDWLCGIHHLVLWMVAIALCRWLIWREIRGIGIITSCQLCFASESEMAYLGGGGARPVWLLNPPGPTAA